MSFRLLTAAALLAATAAATPASAHPPQFHASGGADAEASRERDARTLAFIESRLAAQPDSPMLLSKLGATQLRIARVTADHADLARAERTFRELVRVEPASLGARVGLAHSLLGQHRFAEALTYAREAASIEPDDLSIRSLLGDVHFALGHYAEAEALYDTVAERELTMGSLVRRAFVLELRGRLSEADDVFHQALDAGRMLGAAPADLAWCHTMIGEFDLGGGAIDDAAAHFEAALAIDPGADAAAWHMARIAMWRGAYAEAKAMLTDLVATRPKPAYWTALGDACCGLGEHAAADRWYERAEAEMATEVDRGDFGHARELAELWVTRRGQAARAAELALRDLGEVRRDYQAYETAAWALHRAGRTDEALPLIRDAVRLSRSNARTLWRASVILDAVGRDREALDLAAQARARNPRVEMMLPCNQDGA